MNPDDAIHEALTSLLSNGPVADHVALERLVEAGYFDHLLESGASSADLDLEYCAELLDDISTEHDKVWWDTETCHFHLTRSLIVDRIMTHRIDEIDLERGSIDPSTDLGVLDFDLLEASELTFTGAGVDGAFGRMEWPLPLEPAPLAGDLVGFRRAGDDLVVEFPIPEFVADPQIDALVRQALTDAMASVPDGLGTEFVFEQLEVLARHHELFRIPLAPMTELLLGAGMERRGQFFGPSDRAWTTPTDRYNEMRHRHLSQRFGFTDCCHDAYELAVRAYFQTVEPETVEPETVEPETVEPETVETVREAIAHSAVSLALAEWFEADPTAREDAIAFLEPIATGLRPESAPAHYLLGRLIEPVDLAGAEACYQRALVAADDFIPPHEALGFMAFDRNDLAAALRYFHRSTIDDEPHPIVVRIEHAMRRSAPPTRRNDPCPCGSGRKYKACHQGRPIIDLEEADSLLLDKVAVHLHLRMTDLLEAVEDDIGDLIDDPFVHDVLAFEGGAIDAYIEQRGGLLPADDVQRLRSWQATPRRVHERDGSWMLERVRSTDTEELGPIGPIVVVPDESLAELEAVLADQGGGPGAAGGLIEWYANRGVRSPRGVAEG